MISNFDCSRFFLYSSRWSSSKSILHCPSWIIATHLLLLSMSLAATVVDSKNEDFNTLLDSRRPVWNIAHMVNSIREIDYRLSKGANALEADVTFNASGMPLLTFHGVPCDCMRHCNQQENFPDYLRYTRYLIDPVNTRDNVKNLSLLFLDLKLERLSHQAKVNAGIQLARMVTTYLYSNYTELSPQPIYLVISVNHVNDADLVLNFVHYMTQNKLDNLLMKYIGWDVGMNDDIKLIVSMWKNKFYRTTLLNIWQGDGFTNCLSPFYNLNRLSVALAERDNGNYISKVYQWTIDLHDRIRDALRLNVDGIMTNHPERVITILEEPEFRDKFRMANKLDNPFIRISSTVYTRRLGETAASYNQQVSQPAQQSPSPVVSGGFMGAMSDILYSWLAYTREITQLKVPELATRLIPKRRRVQKEYQFPDNDKNFVLQNTKHVNEDCTNTFVAQCNVTTALKGFLSDNNYFLVMFEIVDSVLRLMTSASNSSNTSLIY